MVAPVKSRPFWSVMIPTYNSNRFLETALRSVLIQDPGPDAMQIEVVDDASEEDPGDIVRRLGGGRVQVFYQPRNLGLAGNWNTCIQRARGEWVHILHADDMVFPGFYRQLEQGIRGRPDVGAAFTRFCYINEEGRWTVSQKPYQSEAGIALDFLERVAVSIQFQCPAVVVRRSVYDQVGFFREDLRYALDWEMWVRIACQFSFWYEPRVLAAFREHRESASAHLQAAAVTIQDCIRAVKIMNQYLSERLGPESAERIRRLALASQANSALTTARRSAEAGKIGQAWRYFFGSFRCRYQPWVALRAMRVLRQIVRHTAAGMVSRAVRRP